MWTSSQYITIHNDPLPTSFWDRFLKVAVVFAAFPVVITCHYTIEKCAQIPCILQHKRDPTIARGMFVLFTESNPLMVKGVV